MTAPRLIRPHATYAICRVVEGRQYLLRPDAVLTALFIWVLAICARAFSIEVHAAVVMSTHYHLVVTVPNENVSEFMHRMNLRLAKAIQVLRRFVRNVVWQPGTLSIVELVTERAIEEAIAYAIVNPVKAGLVYSANEWPGLTTAVEDLGKRVLSAPTPSFFFTAAKWASLDASVRLMLPPHLRALGDDDAARAVLATEVEKQERGARQHVKDNGWKVIGRVAAANTSPYKYATSWQELGALTPHIAAGRGQVTARLEAIRRLKAFRAEHREAKARWIAGDRDVVFPAGTYWMRVHHRANVAGFG